MANSYDLNERTCLKTIQNRISVKISNLVKSLRTEQANLFANALLRAAKVKTLNQWLFHFATAYSLISSLLGIVRFLQPVRIIIITQLVTLTVWKIRKNRAGIKT